MASVQQQKRPSVSNWFSSLRRQPKNKKSSVSSDKQLQRSCFDLSAANSTFYVSPQAVEWQNEASPNRVDVGRLGTYGPESVSYTKNLEAQKKLLQQNKNSASLCYRCCGQLASAKASPESSLSSSSSATPTPTPTSPKSTPTKSPKLSKPLFLLSQEPSKSCSPTTPQQSPSFLFKQQMYSNAGFSPNATPTQSPTSPNSFLYSYFKDQQADNLGSPKTPSTPVSPTMQSQTVIATDYSRYVKAKMLPSSALKDSNTLLMHKTSEFTRTTRTTTTRTMLVAKPVELSLNDKGEVVSRRPSRLSLEKKVRSNSLGCMLDDDDDETACNGFSDPDITPTSPAVFQIPAPSKTLELVTGADELRFIDDSSMQSQNENDCNMDNFARTTKAADEEMFSYSKKPLRSATISAGVYNNNNSKLYKNYNHSNNNNLNNLCEVCKDVVLRNRNNIAESASYNRNQQIKDELCEVVSEMEALNVPEDSKHSNKDKQMSIGRKKFNMDPKKGIEYLVDNNLLRHDPQDVAHFLYKGEGLNKTAIGDYLGEKNDFNEDVLKAFVALHDFTNLILVQALRQFLWSFRLPGEAQKIDRMMETFAQRYCQLNPEIFTNTDTCYVLSFSIIMLNTSLHNPSVKDKPTVEIFISMNRGINNGGDLPRGLLESLYESIRTEPFKIPQDDGNDLMHTFFNPDKEGWLWKQGGRYKSWKRRWFILNDNCLYYFEYTTDKEPRGIIPLENISVREVHDKKPHCFEIFATGGADIIKACKTDSEGKVVEGKHSVYRMSAATEEDQQEWIKRLTQSISHNPFYDILVQRKKKALSKS